MVWSGCLPGSSSLQEQAGDSGLANETTPPIQRLVLGGPMRASPGTFAGTIEKGKLSSPLGLPVECEPVAYHPEGRA